jgi:hypothetical protein
VLGFGILNKIRECCICVGRDEMNRDGPCRGDELDDEEEMEINCA